MGMLDGRTILVTGVLTEASIAFRTASVAQQEGARVVLTGVGRSLTLTQRIARRLPAEPPVVELDVTDAAHLDALAGTLQQQYAVERLDGVVHAIGFAPESALGGGFLSTSWEDVATTMQVSTYSLPALARAAAPLMPRGGAIVGLDFDATVAWPAYDWMGVAKAGLESACRYLARDLGPAGIRVNLVAAGPLRTMAARAIPGFAQFEDVWKQRAPLGWDVDDTTPAARTCVALLSDWLPATTGTVVYADGGVHASGA
ncbi:MAG TPA: enoyl-ACP reductase FabI [Mycobacteriales bacterium]|nr:enoyl-ACP reductase FabI [Mycobacteriales bacterium]